MKAVVFPSRLCGTVMVPPSKSAMQRACALALLHAGKTIIDRPGRSRDDQAAIGLIRSLGAEVQDHGHCLEIKSSGNPEPVHTLQAGESGLSARMFTPIAALSEKRCVITGEGSLLKRPMSFFDEVLPGLGVEIRSDNGHLPFQIKGPLRAQDCSIDGSASSQYLTGLLFSMAAAADKRVVITVSNLVSAPYISLSLSLMKHFGYVVEQEGLHRFIIHPREHTGGDISYTVESDWSHAAMWLVAAATAGDTVKLQGLDMGSVQADKAILGILSESFARLEETDGDIIVEGGVPLEAFRFDATHCPDLFPPLVALASACRGTSHITGIDRLRHKESDRATSLLDVFGKLGVDIRIEGNEMLVTGTETIRSGQVDAHGDHRIAMAASIAALRSDHCVIINGAESVGKSYPDFFPDIASLGAGIQIEP